MRTILFAALVAAILPFASATTQQYVGTGGAHAAGTHVATTILCDGGWGFAVGGGCDFLCEQTCTVTTGDVASPDVHVMVCDWTGSEDVRCEVGGSTMTYVSQTRVIDVFVLNGVAGSITVE